MLCRALVRPYNCLLYGVLHTQGNPADVPVPLNSVRKCIEVDVTREERGADLSGLGLIANPFIPPADGSSDPLGVRLAVNAAALRLLSAFEASVGDDDRKPIVVEKSPEIPDYYNIASMARVFGAVASGDPVPGIMQAYVPLDMMRLGRVRAPLAVVAERISGPGVGLTIAAWSRIALAQADHELPEFEPIADDIDTLIAEIDADPMAFTTRIFGEVVDRREGAEDTEVMMRIAYSRTSRLDTDPEADEASAMAEPASIAEDPTDDPMATAFVTPLGDAKSLAEGEDGASDEELDAEASRKAVEEYIHAYTTEHLSPVVSRGLRAFSAQGTDSMGQELKVTKAPSKTLVALLRLAESRLRLGVVLYDNFAIWPSVPNELRHKIVATFSQLRWSLKDVGVMVFMITKGDAPEVEEAFSSGRHISWDFEELFRVAKTGSAFDVDGAARWLVSAMTSGEMPEWGDALLAAVPENAELESACAALGAAIETAAAAGTLPDPEAIVAADIALMQPAPE